MSKELKKEKLQLSRQREKLEHQLGSIANMTRLPAAVFVVDITKEHIAISEAQKLNIPTFAIVDTNSDPNKVDFAIPANDDASTSIAYILDIICKAVAEGLSERKHDKDAQEAEEKEEVLEKDVTAKYAAAKDEEEKSPAKKGARKRTTTTPARK